MKEAGRAPVSADANLLRRVHHLWFGHAFPEAAGSFRREVVLSRRPHVSAPHAITGDVEAALFGFDDDWVRAGGDATVRRFVSGAEFDRLVELANEVTVRLHHIHPFLDGNTRACMTFRAYLLARAHLPVVTGRMDEQRARAAWNEARPLDHDALDQLLYDEIAAALP